MRIRAAAVFVLGAIVPTLVLAQDGVSAPSDRPDFGGAQLVQLLGLIAALVIALRGLRHHLRDRQEKKREKEHRDTFS